jgi:hypothetical protein
MARMTASEFSKLPETNRHVELMNGEVIFNPSLTIPLHYVLRDMYDLLHSLIPDGELWRIPMDLHFDEWYVSQPDLFWVGKNSRCEERIGFTGHLS